MKVADLQKLINLETTTYSLSGMHQVTESYLKHTQCEMCIGIETAMTAAIRETRNTQQNQSQTMGL